ncbi:MAG: glutathione S-transferase [Pseudomonadota bacterium]
MASSSLPVLYSFRRCPYAMRARLALVASGQIVELREVVLREKPVEMLEASPKGTVPVLVLEESNVLEESLDVIDWALGAGDPEGLTDFPELQFEEMRELISVNDGAFKTALDRYKYPNRYENVDIEVERKNASVFLDELNGRLEGKAFLFGERFSLADAAILPFIRQFAHVDKDWFWSQSWTNVIRWLEAFLESERFKSIMTKYPQWKTGEAGFEFGRRGQS